MFDPARSSGRVLLLLCSPYLLFFTSLLWSKFGSTFFEDQLHKKGTILPELAAEQEFIQRSPFTGKGRSSAAFKTFSGPPSSFYSFTLQKPLPTTAAYQTALVQYEGSGSHHAQGSLALYLLFLEFKGLIILLLLILLYCNIDLGSSPTVQPHSTRSHQEQFHFHREGRRNSSDQDLSQAFQSSQELAAARLEDRIQNVVAEQNLAASNPGIAAATQVALLNSLEKNKTAVPNPSPSSNLAAASNPTSNQQTGEYHYSEFLAEQERIRSLLGMSNY